MISASQTTAATSFSTSTIVAVISTSFLDLHRLPRRQRRRMGRHLRHHPCRHFTRRRYAFRSATCRTQQRSSPMVRSRSIPPTSSCFPTARARRRCRACSSSSCRFRSSRCAPGRQSPPEPKRPQRLVGCSLVALSSEPHPARVVKCAASLASTHCSSMRGSTRASTRRTWSWQSTR